MKKKPHILFLWQSYRRGSTVFAGKHGFITLRDLFRWAERYRLAEQLQKDYDWLQHLANDGELCCPSFLKCLWNCFPAPLLKCKFLLLITQVIIAFSVPLFCRFYASGRQSQETGGGGCYSKCH